MGSDGAFTGSCPIRERTGDGISVGRCWFATYDHKCPRHGNVRRALERFAATQRLTDENDLEAPDAD